MNGLDRMMLDAKKTGSMLGLSARAVYDLAQTGALVCYRVGVGRGAVRFDPADVEAYRAALQSVTARVAHGAHL